jgi:HEAT repeat protein
MYTLPGDVMMMAITGDPRGIPILRQGLSSSNYGVRNAALVGLALIQDKDSIPAMIQAANNAPPGMRDLLARPLVFFDDPRAQTASQEMIKDKRVLQKMQETARTKGPRGEWR